MLDNERWIQTIRHYLHHSRLQLHIPGLSCSERKCDNDVVLMDYALKDPNITYNDILRINRCRLYLRVTTLADLTNAQGTSILSSMYFCMEEGQTNFFQASPLEITITYEQNTIHGSPTELNRNRHEMSDWTFVMSKKMPSSVDSVELLSLIHI